MESQETRIKELVTKLILKNIYWGYLFSKVQKKQANLLIPNNVMAVYPEKNGTISLLFNSEIMKDTEDNELLIVLEHEGIHLLNNHLYRQQQLIYNDLPDEEKNVKYRIFNIAADCSANSQMNAPRKLSIGNKTIELHFPDLYKLPDNKTVEYYFYKLLEENNQKNDNKGDDSKKGNEKKKVSKPSQNNDDSNLIDSHSFWPGTRNDITDKNGVNRKVDSFIKKIVHESKNEFSKSRGTIPGHISQLIDNLLQKPKLPYYLLIKKLVKSARFSKVKRCSTRINRKRTYSFLMDDELQFSPFPGKTRDISFHVTILIDTSASMTTGEIEEALRGIKQIIENDKECKTLVIENDTEVKRMYYVKRVSDIQKDVLGRGGTILLPGLIAAKKEKTDIVLVFTDGFCENINDVPKYNLPKRIVWVLPKNGTEKYINRTGYIVRVV